MDLTTITPSPAGLKALSHPVRLRMLGLLRMEGPATSTTLADRLGLNTGATSYHLRQLADHGFVVDDEGRGTGRERWWKAAHQATVTDTTAADPAQQEVVDAYLQSVAIVHTERLQRAVEERGSVPQEWRAASTLSDWSLRLTAAHASELTAAIRALVEGWDEDDADDDAAEFVIQVGAFPLPDSSSPMTSGERTGR
jgi:DNA-binding transcriptional ArsR family regulator